MILMSRLSDLYQDDAQDMEDYMHGIVSDDDDFSDYGDFQFNFARQAFHNNDSGVISNLTNKSFTDLFRRNNYGMSSIVDSCALASMAKDVLLLNQIMHLPPQLGSSTLLVKNIIPP